LCGEKDDPKVGKKLIFFQKLKFFSDKKNETKSLLHVFEKKNRKYFWISIFFTLRKKNSSFADFSTQNRKSYVKFSKRNFFLKVKKIGNPKIFLIFFISKTCKKYFFFISCQKKKIELLKKVIFFPTFGSFFHLI